MRAIPYGHRLFEKGKRGREWNRQWTGTGGTWEDALSWWGSLAVGSVIQYTAPVKAMEEEEPPVVFGVFLRSHILAGAKIVRIAEEFAPSQKSHLEKWKRPRWGTMFLSGKGFLGRWNIRDTVFGYGVVIEKVVAPGKNPTRPGCVKVLWFNDTTKGYKLDADPANHYRYIEDWESEVAEGVSLSEITGDSPDMPPTLLLEVMTLL